MTDMNHYFSHARTGDQSNNRVMQIFIEKFKI